MTQQITEAPRLIPHRVIGGLVGAAWGGTIGVVVSGLIAVFYPIGVQHFWVAMGN